MNERVDYWLRGYFHETATDTRDFRLKSGKAGPKKPWKNIDFLRLRDVALHLLDPRPGKRILDVGCANGPTMIYCGLQGAEVYGQDLDPVMVKSANYQLRRFKLTGEAKIGDAAQLTFPDNHFDGVISSDFVEHIDAPTKVRMFSEARRVLKPGGLLVTKTPNLAYLKASLLFKRLRALSRLKDPRSLVIPHTPGTDDPQHIGLSTRWTLTHCLQEAGFLNYQFHYPPLRRFGNSPVVEVLSTEIPVVRDVLSEDLICTAYKPITLSHFPE
jgi:2-polyprenyl-3-methyl-5-hydroxy-6-metoxy-1,4-benzoquinol methylase